ncbi:MAG: aldo/keto reductase [Spirochaetales bacterium]|nr:aldo/keto reductase [Spirochaetales bacterium]
MKYLTHRGIKLPLVGIGSWFIGENPSKRGEEIASFLHGIEEYSMTLIDTAEMYGYGESEKLIAEVLKKKDREDLFIVDKILPNNAEPGVFRRAFERSLRRLGTDYIDLYLLHWWTGQDLQFVIDEMENLKSRGLIKEWGVSNFDVDEMEELLACDGGENCFVNQVLYNITSRGIEYDLIPYLKEHDILPMAYSPLANNMSLRRRFTMNSEVQKICKETGLSPEALMLSFVIRNGDIITAPKAGSRAHVDLNMKCLDFDIKPYMAKLDGSFPPPRYKMPLDIL